MSDVKTYSLAKDGNTYLSEHFKVSEFACHDGSDTVLISSKLVQILEKIRSHFGKAVHINSGYRTESYNATVSGSSKTSKHCLGMAADIRINGCKPAAVAAYAESLLPNTGGIGTYKTFTHIDVRANKARWKG